MATSQNVLIIVGIIVLVLIIILLFRWNRSQKSYQQSSTASVSMRNISFNPPTLNIPSGTTVTWTNQENISHTVTSGTPDQPSGLFDSGILRQGQPFQFTFTTLGRFLYYCRIHGSAMTGIINVT